MQYYHLLYSRTRTRDYRWIRYPTIADKADQASLDRLFASYFNCRRAGRLTHAAVPPIYFVRLSTIAALVTCGLTEFTDRYQRPIYALQGICVETVDTRHLWFALPLLLNELEDRLQIWPKLSFEAENAKIPQPMTSHSLHLNEIDSVISYLAALHQSAIEPTTLVYPILLPFDGRGLDDLMRYCASPSLPAGDILFGAAPEMERAFPRPMIKAPI